MVYILTVVHNRKATTTSFCESLCRQTYKDFVLVLVDDGSTDGTSDLAKSYPFRCEICRGQGNLWWGGGVRKGIARIAALKPAPDDVVLIANDDTTFEPDFLRRALSELQENGRGKMMVVSVRFTDTGGYTDGGSVCYWPRLTFHHYGRHPERIDCASTRCLFIHYADLERSGTFRPRLVPHYFSDYEFTIRARRRGVPIVPAYTVMCSSTEGTTGVHRLKPGPVIPVLRQMLSPRFSANPLSLFSFVLLAAPLRWKVVCWVWALRTASAFFLRATIYNRLASRAS